MMGLALAAWLVCFGVLARTGTWLPFGLVGPLLAVANIGARAVPLASLRPSLKHSVIGLLSGLLMVGSTHVGYRLLAVVLPSVLPATSALFGLIATGGPSAGTRAVLIVVIASCEEILFRGPLLGSTPGNAAPSNVAPSKVEGSWPRAPRGFGRVSAFAVAYALTTAPLESPLLVLCALGCASIWGALTLLTRALTAPILAHAVWDLGVLLLWPLAARH
jgi:membrane protease YdiL (CAAX protease family)